MNSDGDQINGNGNDTLLWKRFKEGDAIAFTELSRTYYKALYNYGRRFSTDDDFVLDCIQELFLHLWERRSTISETTFVKSYLLKSLRHRIIKEGVRLRRFQNPEAIEFGNESSMPVEHDIIENEQQSKLVSKLNHTLSGLSRRQQEIIYLRFYHNLDNDQIAQVMGLGKASVANLLYRTLKEIRENWLTVDLAVLLFTYFSTTAKH